MPSDGAFRRLELALSALGLTATAIVSVVAMDAVQFHLATLWRCLCHLTLDDMALEGWLFVALALADVVIVSRAGSSLWRQLTAQRRLLRALPVSHELHVGSHRVRVIPGRGFHVFCAGLVRPAVYVSDGVMRGVSDGELAAILAHEAHHRARRDPLRMLIARVITDAFRPLPPFARLADRHEGLVELAADAAAVRTLGDRQPLAAALVRFDELAPRTGHGVAPERVHQLLRESPPDNVSPWLLVSATGTLAALASVGLPMLVFGWHPAPTLPTALELGALLAAFAPAYLASRRAERCLTVA